jgi:hypothetical protein
MKRVNTQIVVVLVVGILIGYFVVPWATGPRREGFQDTATRPHDPECDHCGESWPCRCRPDNKPVCPDCPPMPDMSKYVLKSSIPPCATCPDLSQYMLKTECPSVPDMSQYVLKASIPKLQPVIVDTSASKKCGDCPPCPRPRCPEVKCPAPTVCPACPPCPRAACPETVVKCKAEEVGGSPVRPYLAPLAMNPFGSA